MLAKSAAKVLDAATPLRCSQDRGIYAFVDPRQRDRGHLGQIDDPGTTAHIDNTPLRSSTSWRGRECRTSISTAQSLNRLHCSWLLLPFVGQYRSPRHCEITSVRGCA